MWPGRCAKPATTGRLWGMGGGESRRSDIDVRWDGERLQLLGLAEVVSSIPSIWALGREIVRQVLREQPDCVVVADSPDFHMRLISWLRHDGYRGKIFYISPPSVWAWRSGRADDLRRNVDECLPLFRFEHEYLLSRGCRSYWKGYPMLEEFSRENIRRSLPDKLASDEKLVAILPGSRRSEIKYLLPTFEQCSDVLASRGWHPVFSVAPGLNGAVRESMLARFKESGADYYEGPGRELLAAARCAIGASGTVTVESLLLDRYMVVAYRLNALSALIGRFVLKTRRFAMANILAGTDMFPELIQSAATKENILKYALEWLEGGEEHRAAVVKMMEDTRRTLGETGVYKAWAGRIMEAAA
jgi:lipid-A-disaccharide synthase